ncbi:MAG: hypothetical protein IKD72_10015 [Clostridia bacterium]|nr:hypothetical protein [Clostridia bacterium]
MSRGNAGFLPQELKKAESRGLLLQKTTALQICLQRGAHLMNEIKLSP